MSRILTLTLNPAVDLACVAGLVEPTKKVRATDEQFDPGGGGINVARVISELGGEALAVLAAGGATGRFLTELLGEIRVENLVVPITGRTRICVAVHEAQTGKEFRFVPEGPVFAESEWRAVLDAVENLEASWLVASGSLPRGVPDDFYARLGVIAIRRGWQFVLDASGAALRIALGQGVTLIKPNLVEFEALVGRQVRDPEEQKTAASALARSGAARLVVVSLGAEGAIVANRDRALRLRAPEVVVRSGVGAGDSLVAGMTLALARGLDHEEALAWGLAAGTAAVLSYGTARLRRAEAEALYRQIREQQPGR
jgi:6-phosphofructokinase 2